MPFANTAAFPPLITIVAATYNRPDGLGWAIESVLNQGVDAWRMLVVGDACGPETSQVVRSFGDPRLSFVNLAQRCGEQSGPNSVGMALAEGEYLAFLNHDDVWLPDHLEIGLERLRSSGADFFAGRAAFALPGRLVDGLPGFTEASPLDRRQSQAFRRAHYLFEPASSWLIRRSAAARVGPWRSALELHRSPAEDWVLRSWRCGVRVVSDPRVTVLKLKSSAISAVRGPTYESPPIDLSPWVNDAARSPDQLRRRIAHQIELASLEGLTRDFVRRVAEGIEPAAQRRALSHLNAWRYRWMGVDAFDRLCDRSGLSRGAMMRRALANRTGEQLGRRPDLERLIEAARKDLGNG